MNRKIFFTLIILALGFYCSPRAEEAAAPVAATATAQVKTNSSPVNIFPVNPVFASEPIVIEPLVKPEGGIEKKAAVIKVDGFKVYVDAGSIQGVSKDTIMEVYRMVPLLDMNDEILDYEKVVIGSLEVEEVRPRLSVCRPKQMSVPFERGNFVRFFMTEVSTATLDTSGRCPAEMLFDPGGPFVFKPGSVFDTGADNPSVTEDTPPFCIDQYPVTELTPWAAAFEACREQGKRLCERLELQKVCAVWEKPKPCPQDVRDSTGCPAQNTVMDFKSDLEWAFQLSEDDEGLPFQDAFSCKCSSVSPICAHCYYPECRGAKKFYRCCHDTYPEK